MSRQEQLELQNSSGATTCTHHRETAGCSAENPSKKGSQAFPRWKPRLPQPQHPKAGRHMRTASAALSGNQAWTETLHISQIHTPEVRVVAVLCLIPTTHLGITVHTGTLQGLLRGFLFAAHVLDLGFPGGKCPPPSLVLPAADRGVHRPGLMPGMEISAQPMGNHPHRTQPASSHPPSESLSISSSNPSVPLIIHRPPPNAPGQQPWDDCGFLLSTPRSTQGFKQQPDVNFVTSVRTN